jgi:hypothetical protein
MNRLEKDLRGDKTMKLSNSVRGMFFAFTTCTVGLGLLAVSGHAQNTQSKQTQKEKTVTQTAVWPRFDPAVLSFRALGLGSDHDE